MAVVVEPVVTREKLVALLAEEHEQSVLDYKTSLNLGRGHAQDIVELAKDIAALRAEPAGGYIVVGADDHGKPVPDLTSELVRHFDEAVLRPKLEKYIDASDLRCAVHEVEGNQLALIYVPPAAIGWCIFRAPGEFEDNGKGKVYVFRVGEVFVRHGTSSERWTDADRERLISQIVDRRKEAWRGEVVAEFMAQARLAHTVQGLQELPATAITWRIDSEAFDQLTTELLRRNDDIALRTLLTQAGHDAATLVEDDDRDELGSLLDRAAALAALAIHHERPAWWKRALDTFELIYELGLDEFGNRRGAASAQLWLDVIARVYGLGALAVRLRDWQAVRALAKRCPAGAEISYYGSWLRHALTTATRARIVDTQENAGLLARAHNVIREVPALRPDRPADHPAILNSLTQFDVYSAFVAIGTHHSTDHRYYYTNFARYHTERSTPAFVTIVTDPQVRGALFDGDDELLAQAIDQLATLARQEGFRYDGWIGFNEPAVNEFLREHLPQQR